MMVSGYSLLMAVVWFTVVIIVLNLLFRKYPTLAHRGVGIFLFCVFIGLFRLFVPIETSLTAVIPSTVVFPAIKQALDTQFTVVGANYSLGTYLLIIWGIGSVISAMRLAVYMFQDYCTVKKLLKKSVPNKKVEQSFQVALPHSKCTMVVSKNVPTPMALGYFHSYILIPQQMIDLPEKELYYVFLHEWQHIKNYDVWIKLFFRFLCCLLWWNPAIYLLERNLEQILELRVDISITKELPQAEKKYYLQTILDVLQALTEPKKDTIHASSLYIGVEEDFELRQRFMTVIQYRKPSRLLLVGTCAAMVGCLVLSYSVVLQPEEYPEGKSAAEVFEAPQEGTYIIRRKDGVYVIVVDGTVLHGVTPEMMEHRPFSEFEIIYE